MNQNFKESKKQKHQFKAKDYCVSCQQRKSCGLLEGEKKHCCVCYREILEELEQDGLLISSAQQTLNDYRQGIIKKQKNHGWNILVLMGVDELVVKERGVKELSVVQDTIEPLGIEMIRNFEG